MGLVHTRPADAQVIGDDYPKEWKTGGNGVDPWNMYWRQCTSFVAWRLSHTNGFSLPYGYGNAITWGRYATSNGYLVDKNPAVGAVAWFTAEIPGVSPLGHVSWVADVKGDYVTLEEYNYNAGQGPEKYYSRTIHKSQVSGFIHFKDLGTKQEIKSLALKVGDTVSFTKSFQVTSYSGSYIASTTLAGGTPTSLNLIDPGPVFESTATGQRSGDQVLYPGEYFTIPGQFKILAIDPPTNGILLKIGNRNSWVTASVLKKG
ncbi:CHAP domain-containing protein [Streptococcus sp. DD13]|uniref:CHAP domain-containing protein n=1 Tax=Streptococcus sp. DD13 TaxID=1777881 RepID=UPI003FA7EB04